MTAKQKQLILCCFDLMAPADVDGIWGRQSMTATRMLQHGLGIQEDGDFGRDTLRAALERLASGEPLEVEEEIEVPGKYSEFFERAEFGCPCEQYCNGFPVEPDPELVRDCNEIRRRLGVPVGVNSGVRCPTHNANVGGVANSNHRIGKAADLSSSKSPQEMYRVADEVLGNTGELGLYSWGIHVAVNCAYSRFTG